MGTGRRILVMEDDEMLRDVTAQMLVELGYEVTLSENGSEAIDIYCTARKSGERIDLVMLDLTIAGGMGGKETINRLRQIDPEVRAVATSGSSADPIMSHFRQHGFEGAIKKPFKLRELDDTVKKALSMTQ